MYLELRDLWKSYRNQTVPAIQGITLEIRSERITALAGESGSGKTTLLRLIAGFEKPDRGAITHNGRPFVASGIFVPPQKRSVAMIFQDLALFPHLSASANVAFGMKHVARRDRTARVEALLESIGLGGLADKYPHELSGGQRQRVALARALASEAETILMDEPFSNLDPELKWKMIKEVRSILKHARKTVVFVTHDRDEAFALADDIAVIKEGKLLQYGDPREVYRQPASHAVARFFGPVNRIPASAVCGLDPGEPFEEILVRPEWCQIESRNGTPSACQTGVMRGNGIVSLGEAESDTEPRLHRLAGTVSTSRFMGEFWEVEVTPESAHRPETGTLIVRAERPRENGEHVWVVLPSSERFNR